MGNENVKDNVGGKVGSGNGGLKVGGGEGKVNREVLEKLIGKMKDKSWGNDNWGKESSDKK